MIKRELFALEMESLTSQMKRLQIEERVVTLLNDFWDQVCGKTVPRGRIEFTCEHDGMEFSSWRIESAAFLFPRRKEVLVSIELPLEVKDTSRILVESYHSTNILERLAYEAIYPKDIQGL